jgi:agmatine deiminase
MLRILTLLVIGLFINAAEIAAQNGLPRGLTDEERRMLHQNNGLGIEFFNTRGIETPPDFPALRTMAEWEEIQALCISWTSYPTILKNIVRNAKNECLVIILTENANATENYLMGSQAGGPLDNMDNIYLLSTNFDSIWMRDYGANTVYGNEVDDLILVDWIYNRPSRPNDNVCPEDIAEYLGLEIYTTTNAPTDLVNTGGNFMSDGFGTAFASKLILEENEAGNEYGVTVKSESDIDEIMLDWMGLERYIKMEMLPFDEIHHIDMHMKLLDEETILVGDFPGVADGPQIQANIEYVLANFNSKWGTPYKIKWIPMVPSTSDTWPNTNAAYRTYTNSVFINNTLIYPSYREEYDTTAQRIYEELLPGYNVIPIDCDNDPDPIIFASGAIHCITHSVGVADPLLISHQPLADTDDDVNDYQVDAYIKHRSGIANATLYYKTDLAAAYQSVAMVATDSDIWTGNIPAQPAGTRIYYYVEGEAVSGKVQVRPIVAPEGYWSFRILGDNVSIQENGLAYFKPAFPNPASAITCVPVFFNKSLNARIVLRDITGKEVLNLVEGRIAAGESKYFFDASALAAGAYMLVIESDQFISSQKIMIE